MEEKHERNQTIDKNIVKEKRWKRIFQKDFITPPQTYEHLIYIKFYLHNYYRQINQ